MFPNGHLFINKTITTTTFITQQAFYLARTGRPGPVLVDVPKDIQQQLAVPDWDAPMAITGYMSRLPPPPDAKAVTDIIAALKEAKRPVLYVGGGCLDASEELRAFVARTNIPVAQTLMGLGTYPETDALALQVCKVGGLCGVCEV